MFVTMFLFCLPALADVSVPRAKQYAWFNYSVPNSGGESAPHAVGLTLPAGGIITNMWVYINTQFAASGTESLGISCAGSQDLMAYSSIKTTAKDRIFAANISGSTFIGAAAPIPFSKTILDFSQGYGSIPSACDVVVNVRADNGYTPYTAGSLTTIIEYFKLQ